MADPLSPILSGLSSIVRLLTRHIDSQNQTLEHKRKLANELYDTCRHWSDLLIETFRNAAVLWDEQGKEAAAAEMRALQRDFQKLNYWSVKEESPIIHELLADKRFEDFASACTHFYEWALQLKEMVMGQIKDDAGKWFDVDEVGIKRFVDMWSDEVERMLKNVTFKWMEVKRIGPK